MLAGSNPFLLTRMVLSETRFGRVGDTDSVVTAGGGVAIVSCGAVGADVGTAVPVGCVGEGWVQPLTSTRKMAMVKKIIFIFIMRSL
jgi:hypothetical protein